MKSHVSKTGQRRAARVRVGAIIGLAAFLIGMSGISAGRSQAAANLQDATDASSVACNVAAPSGSASPVAEAPLPTRTPVVTASPRAVQSGTIAADIDHAVRLLAACLSEGRSAAVAELVTEKYLGAVYGGGDRLSREEYLALAPDLPAIAVAVNSVDDVKLDSNNRASADVVTVVGNQLEHGRWTFVQSTDATGKKIWQVDAVESLAVQAPTGAAKVSVGLSEYDFKLSQREVKGPDLTLSGSNTGKEDHELLVLRLDSGISTDILLQVPGPGLPPGVEFIGQVTIPAGEQADLVLVGLPPASYAIVCLLPDKDGTPHLALGMRARIRVT
jgi:hypothetical protein